MVLQKELLKFSKQTMNQPESSQIFKTKADWPAKINYICCAAMGRVQAIFWQN